MALSKNDQFILEYLCNPLAESPATAAAIVEESQSETEPVNAEVIKLEAKAAAVASAGKHEEALEIINDAIKQYPEWASAYNNRAQIKYLLKDEPGAIVDLDVAIRLWQHKPEETAKSVAEKAFTQRALLRGKLGDESGCNSDLHEAAELGSIIAKKRLASNNPYAALCSDMVSLMMARELGTDKNSAQ